MRKNKGVVWRKRILSVILAMVMVAMMLSSADWGMIAKADVASKDETVSYEGTTKTRVRGVLNELPIPNDKRSGTAYDEWLKNWYNAARGTVDRPFLILEIVPYYEQGNIGYLIEGCEPVALERMTGNEWMYSLGGYSTLFKVSQATGNIYFFTDEAEGKQSYYVNKNGDSYRVDDYSWNNSKLKKEAKDLFGYYECVEEGMGNFRIAEEDGKKKIVKADNASVDKKGTLNWHTVNDYLKDKWEANGYKEGVNYKKYKTLEVIQDTPGSDIDDFISNVVKIDQVGSRYFTTRSSSAEDPYVDVTGMLFDYSNNDSFATTAIGLTKEQTKTYSIWIKTITPVELNANPQWADISDLVFVQRFSHDTTMTDLFGAKDKSGAYYNRLQKTFYANAKDQNKSVFSGNYDSSDYPGYNGKAKDISWTVASKLFQRVASAKNYCGLVFDKTFRDNINSPDTKDGIQYRVYDLNDNQVGTDQWNGVDKAYRCNIGKLWTMCVSSKPNLVQRFYASKLEGKTTSDPNYNIGVFKNSTNRTSDEKEYWSALSFYFASDVYPGVKLQDIDSNTTYWDDYSGYVNTTADVTYVHGHVYTYNGNQSLFQTFNSGTTGARADRFKSFDEYLKTNARTREIWELPENKALWSAANGGAAADYSKVTTQNIAPWAALRYILDLDNDKNPFLIDDIYVLDIEPTVKLDKDSKPVYELDANKVALMVPSISADANIRINSMISGSFVGRNEDLNSTYDMIYIGDDAGGFMTGEDIKYWGVTKKTNTNDVWAKSVASAGMDRTDFVDNTMDGQLYFHIGDYYTVASDVKGNFIYDVAGGEYDYNASNEHTFNTGQTTRQPGNDFTSIKVKEIKSYIKAGYPVVAATNLFDSGDHPYVDQTSYLWGLLSGSRATKNSEGEYSDGIFTNLDISGIDARVRLRKNSQMKILSTPVKYDSNHKASSYLPKEGVYGKLQFKVQAPNTTDYSYRVYLDQDRNGKFSSSEIVQTNPISTRTTDITVYVTDGWVGFIQWRIEVYKTANEDARISETGCSAIEAGTGDKNKILALQIIPNGGSDVDLSTHTGNGTARNDNKSWTNLYDFCTDFEIEVYKVTFAEFEKFFRKGVNGDGASYGFSYDMAQDINVSDTAPLASTNPRRDIVELVEKQTEHEALKNKYLGGHTLSEFNMIVIGFKDSYGNQDFSNKYGCAEYLFYFADKGKSILFTHDLAHYRNRLSDAIGRSATSMLRDIIGMNRYGVVNYRLINDVSADVNFNVDKTGRLAKSLAAYNTKKGIPFEKNFKNDHYDQGYTFANLMSKVGQNAGGNRRSMYKYVMVNANNGNAQNLNNGGNINNSLAETNKVKLLNEGQITQYPYNIDPVLTVNKTHYQYYQLNMEDPQLTVWFTLEAANVYGGTGTNHQLYAVLPQEAANNYYIYSKGNIFYSGVGHSGISGDPERKLFVNTLIAAYRPTLQEPEIIVTNTDATRNGKRYTIRVEREYDYDEEGNLLPMSEALSGDVDVFFLPRDYSGSPTLKVRIYYEGESQFFGADSGYYIYEAKLNELGQKVRGDRVTTSAGVPNTYILNTEKEYVIVYQKSRLNLGDAMNHIIFEAKNDRVATPSITDLFFKPRPMFILD
ncbi:MAG: DUF5057 domain-containing protein [Lachnospiraceae bacterium]|nr:DUF5057 domain-containing protein [Lachnospiraceae bacterium]